MVSTRGALETARELLRSGTPSEGFTALWGRGRLDLTVEALARRREFRSLFTHEELVTARSRLERHGNAIPD